jgi:hypothetical protein
MNYVLEKLGNVAEPAIDHDKYPDTSLYTQLMLCMLSLFIKDPSTLPDDRFNASYYHYLIRANADQFEDEPSKIVNLPGIQKFLQEGCRLMMKKNPSWQKRPMGFEIGQIEKMIKTNV